MAYQAYHQVRLYAGNTVRSPAEHRADAVEFDALAAGTNVLVQVWKPIGAMLDGGRETALLGVVDPAVPSRPILLDTNTPYRLRCPKWAVLAALPRLLPLLTDTEFMKVFWTADDADCRKMAAILVTIPGDDSDSEVEEGEDGYYAAVGFCSPLLTRATMPFSLRM